MGITYNSKVEKEVLYITASGKDENVKEVIEYGRSIIKLANESKVKRVICDERNLEYAIETLDIFESAQTMASEAPKVGRLAIVCNPKFLDEGKFWETVAFNRGLQVRMDTDFDRAKNWLINED
jgi:hypothetical protein